MKNKTLRIFFTFVVVMGIYLISIPAGEFVAAHDAGMGQVVFFLAVLLGMMVFYGAEKLLKKYPLR